MQKGADKSATRAFLGNYKFLGLILPTACLMLLICAVSATTTNATDAPPGNITEPPLAIHPGCHPDGGPINIDHWWTDEYAYQTCGVPPHMRRIRYVAPGTSAIDCLSPSGPSDLKNYKSDEIAYITCGFPMWMKKERFSLNPGCLESKEGPKDIHLWPSDEEAYDACGFPPSMRVRRVPVGNQECVTETKCRDEIQKSCSYTSNIGSECWDETYEMCTDRPKSGPKDLRAWASDAEAYLNCGFPAQMREKKDVPKRLYRPER